jgi:hypothetical protein
MKYLALFILAWVVGLGTIVAIIYGAVGHL